MLGKSQRHWRPADVGIAASDWQCRSAGLKHALSAAPLRLLGYGADPDAADWLCLDPVHLRVEQRRIVVEDPAKLDLTLAEAHALAADLAPLFAEIGEISVAAPTHWHLRLHTPLELEFAPLPAVIGRSADALLQQDRTWLHLLNETQMRLHAHPLNRAREAQGKPAVSAVWPWGQGKFAAAELTEKPIALHGSGAIEQGIARLLGVALQAPLPRYTHELKEAVLFIDDFAGPTQNFDAQAWREALLAFEANWLLPALAALREHRLKSLTLCALGEEASLTLRCTPSMLWHFWRKPLPPNALALPE